MEDTYTVEDKVRICLGLRPDLPDWMHMKAIELSRALDEAEEEGCLVDVIISNLIFGQLALERRIRILELLALEKRVGTTLK